MSSGIYGMALCTHLENRDTKEKQKSQNKDMSRTITSAWRVLIVLVTQSRNTQLKHSPQKQKEKKTPPNFLRQMVRIEGSTFMGYIIKSMPYILQLNVMYLHCIGRVHVLMIWWSKCTIIKHTMEKRSHTLGKGKTVILIYKRRTGNV